MEKVKNGLAAEGRGMFELGVEEGLSVTEVAKIVGQRRETVSRKLSDAKERARKAIGPAS